MRETVLLVLFFLGGAVFLYGVGLPLTWVIALPLIAALAVDFILHQPMRSGTAVKKMRDPDQDLGVQPTGSSQMDEEPKDTPQKEPEWKSFSVLRVPVNRGDANTSTRPVNDAVTDAVVVRPASHSPVAGQVAHSSSSTENGQQGRPVQSAPVEEARVHHDPLAHYQTDQFEGTARPAPVEAFTPKVETVRTNSPFGPAWVPPQADSRPVRSAGVPRTPRPIPPVLKPEDFQQNAGKRGYLYLARNPEHWDGLFKVGQTIHHPSRRVTELNKQHAKHKDIGLFDLLEVVEVVDAYGAEQVLFKVLNDLRPVQGREFFIADQGYLSMVMHAVADFIRGRPDALNRLYRDLDPQQFPSWPGRIPRYIHHGVGRAKGWVYLARCQYHFADTYLFGATSSHPETALRVLNEGQKQGTPQIGFYTMVFALPVSNTTASRTIGWRAMSTWKLKGSRSYIRGPLEQISRALTDSLSSRGNLPTKQSGSLVRCRRRYKYEPGGSPHF